MELNPSRGSKEKISSGLARPFGLWRAAPRAGPWTAAQERVLGPAREGGRGERREVTVDGRAEDAEGYRLDVIRDLRENGHHDPEAHRAKWAPPANLSDGMLAAITSWEGDGLSASSGSTYRDGAVRG
ncbi:hypothetical protein LBMAG42_36680 [Deltaproteobacteria bacterium]|nr:hypothetical protein LBMAG42_36680 [Deltaproteobacteria bacterium]